MQRGSTILVVEDDRGLRDFMATWLDAEGYDVRTAQNGRDALTSLREEIPSLMLVDLIMPVMGGAELRRRIQLMPNMAEVPFILVTGEANAEQIGRDLNATAVVPKPFAAIRLSAILASHAKFPPLTTQTRVSWPAHA
jgi:CheY-like chemotaxis protein